jgi:tellurite resistance protein
MPPALSIRESTSAKGDDEDDWGPDLFYAKTTPELYKKMMEEDKRIAKRPPAPDESDVTVKMKKGEVLAMIEELKDRASSAFDRASAAVSAGLDSGELAEMKRRLESSGDLIEELVDVIGIFFDAGTDIMSSSSDDDAYFEAPLSLVEDVKTLSNELAVDPKDKAFVVNIFKNVFPLMARAVLLLAIHMVLSGKFQATNSEPATNPFYYMLFNRQEFGATSAKRLHARVQIACHHE